MSRHHEQGQCCSASSFPKDNDLFPQPAWILLLCHESAQQAIPLCRRNSALEVFGAFTVSGCLSLCSMPCLPYDREIWDEAQQLDPARQLMWQTIPPWGSGIPGTDALQHVSVQEHEVEMRKHHGNRKSFSLEEKEIFSEKKNNRKPAFGVFFYWYKHTKNIPYLDLGWNVHFTIDSQ